MDQIDVTQLTPIDMIRSRRGMLARIADELGLARSTISEWTRVPAERLPEVERITGISRHILRPDICPPPGGDVV